MFTIEIIYPSIEKQEVFYVEYKNNLTIEMAINISGILEKYPEIDLTINHVGIYNQVKKLSDSVNGGDRIEIYRNLIANPKEIRRKRAIKQKEAGII